MIKKQTIINFTKFTSFINCCICMNPENKANFIKRVEKRSKSHHFSISQITTTLPKTIENKSCLASISIKRQDIKQFEVIGIVDKKVIVTFNNQLRLFGYFDLHAVHERIRYQYYCWKIKAQEWTTTELCTFNQNAIEKGQKLPQNAYGNPKKCLIKINNSKMYSPKEKSKGSMWGMTFETNLSNQCYITSVCTIFGKYFSQSQIIQMTQELIFLGKGRIPSIIDQWIGQYSCKSAFKFNDDLKIEQAKLLIPNLGKCTFPWHCVHGRTTIHVKSWPMAK